MNYNYNEIMRGEPLLKQSEQYFMIALLKKELTKSDCNISGKLFYTMTGCLSKNEIITGEFVDNGKKKYGLTTRGQIIALALSTITTDKDDKNLSKMFPKLYGDRLNG